MTEGIYTMENTTFGYARVSSRDQYEERQVVVLLEMGEPEQTIYVDQQFGKDFNMPQYEKLLRRVRPENLIYSELTILFPFAKCSCGLCMNERVFKTMTSVLEL